MKHKQEPPGGLGRLSWNVSADDFDLLNESFQASKKQAHPTNPAPVWWRPGL